MRALVVLVLLGSILLGSIASAQPATALHDANAAAAAGDWARVTQLVGPLVDLATLPKSEQAEIYRLAGVAAFYEQRPVDADRLLFAYLRLDLDGQLDPAIYPPEAIGFLANVRENHKAELRALRPKIKGSIWLNLLPPVGQFQNGEHTKGLVLGTLLGGFVVANVTTYVIMSSWCTRTSGSGGSGLTCDDKGDHSNSASTLRSINIASGIGLIATYVYGVYDGVSHYRRRQRELMWTPYATGNGVGVLGSF